MERRAAVRRAAAMRRRLQRLSSWAGRLVRRRGLALAGLTAVVLLLVDGYNWGFVAPHVTFHKYRCGKDDTSRKDRMPQGEGPRGERPRARPAGVAREV